MSVIVKGMKMPKYCDKCYFCWKVNDHEFWCNFPMIKSGRDCIDNPYIRQDWCPLVEVPDKHGRLIDADTLFGWHKGSRTKYPVTPDHGAYNTLMMYEIFDEIEDAPTIVEAEGG